MTNWRERGYVPPSDGEESDSELETQETYPPHFNGHPPPPSSPLRRLPALQSSQITARQGIQTLDLSNVPDDDDVEEMDLDHEEGGVTIQKDAAENLDDGQRFESPDPITGEPQPIPATKPRPPTATIRAVEIPQEVSSSATSSPLSSPPGTPPTPPSSVRPHPSATSIPAAELAVVIRRQPTPPSPRSSEPPAINPTSPFFRQRSLRQRNPIQQNPYSLEAARYRSTLRKSGVQPVRVLYPGGEGRDGNDDSQDAEYVAPPEPEERRPRTSTTRDASPATPAVSRHHRTSSGGPKGKHAKVASADGRKRRKINHARGSGLLGSNSDILRGRTKAFTGDSTNERMRDIWDFPDSPSPPRPRRHTLTERDINHQPQATLSRSPNPNATAADLSWLDTSGLDDDWDKDLHSTARPRIRPQIFSSSSSSPKSRRLSQESVETIQGDPGDGGNSSAAENNSEDESQPLAGGPQKVLNRFKKLGTKGILPASYLRLNAVEPQHSERVRSTRHSSEQASDPRPGVARTKVSHRVRASSLDFFRDELGDDGSSDSSMEMVLGVAKPRKSRNSKPSTMRTRVVDLVSSDDDSDIPEDNRIDFGHSAAPRRRITNPSKSRRRKKQTDIRSSMLPSTAPPSRKSNTAASGARRTGQRQRSSAPRVGIVDAVRHSRSTGTSVPRFARIAARTAAKRPNKGRQSPSRKLIVLETANDTADVREIMRNWREDTLPFRPQASASERDRSRSPRRTQARIPSPQPLGEQRLEKTAKPRARGPQNSTESRRLKQKSLNGYITQEPVADRQHAPKKKRSQAKDHIILPGNPLSMTHQPRNMPRPAQGERTVNSRGRIRDFADVLRESVTSLSSLPRATTRSQVQPPSRATAQVATSGNDMGPQKLQPRKLRRKQTPKRLDIDLAEFRQPPQQDLQVFEPLSPTESVRSTVSVPQAAPQGFLTGLLPYGSKYSLHFDIHPLKPGTRFNSQTFIGMGLLKAALETPLARVSTFARVSAFTFGDMELRWGMYDESVASEFERICESIADAVERTSQANSVLQNEGMREMVVRVYSFFQFVVRYVAERLHFYDPVDVLPFGQRILQSIQAACDRIVVNVPASSASVLDRPDVRLLLTMRVFALTIALQVFRLSVANPSLQSELELPEYIQNFGRLLVGRLLRYDFPVIRQCYEDQRRHTKFEEGINQDHYSVEIWVLAMQLLDNTGLPGLSFWGIVNEELHLNSIDRSTDLKLFESRWQTLFSFLPLFQFDRAGIAMTFDKPVLDSVNWTLIQKLANRPLKLYNDHRDEHLGTVNDYCRVIFARCHHLISKWHWDSADQIIPTLYQFFSAMGLSNLPNEPDRGAPSFLQNLDETPSLELQDSDRCFHILLKIIAMGVRRMTQQGLNRKIQSLMFRLNPNHRRSYPRGEEFRMEQLVPLRNHHDLLTTLYWAAPPGSRLPLDAIRIVDPETSHHYACNIAVRAWDNLVKFQLHSGEDTAPLVELMGWFDEFISKILGQHHVVQNEAQNELEAQKEKGEEVPNEWLEETVRRRELRLEVILMDMVTAVRLRLKEITGDRKRAMLLLTAAGAPAILNTSTRTSSKLMLEVLDVLRQYIETCEAPPPVAAVVTQPAVLQHESEESQDYGGSDMFDDFELPDDLAPIDVVKEAAEHFLTVAYAPLHRTLSNSFGADKPPKDPLLIRIIGIWAQVAAFLIRHGLKSWESYLEHSNESWSSLRDTPQTRKFTSYFLPKVIEYGGPAVYHANKDAFLQYWMKCIVEREAGLRYQNEFTAAVLNADGGNPIFANPPFARDAKRGVFVITQEQFKLRRLALISGICEDMRVSFASASPAEKKNLKPHYAELLRSLMRSMRDNYESLLHSQPSISNAAQPTGAYIAFAHSVVSLLQQHTTDIVEIDRYFTDSSAFPLPANDPNYVISRLKKYATTIERPGTQKELNMFLMTQVERVAMSGDWGLLVGWLDTATRETVETSGAGMKGLRAYFLEVLLGAYTECVAEYEAGWVVAWPILVVAEKVVRGLRVGFDAFNEEERNRALETVTEVVVALRRAVGRILVQLSDATPPTAQRLTLLSLFLRITIAAVPPAAHFLYHNQRHRNPSQQDQIRSTITESISIIFRSCRYVCFAFSPPSLHRQSQEVPRPGDPLALQHNPQSHQRNDPAIRGMFDQGRVNVAGELRNALRDRWRIGGGVELEVLVGKERIKVVVPPLVSEGPADRNGGVDGDVEMEGVEQGRESQREKERRRLEEVVKWGEEVARDAGVGVDVEEEEETRGFGMRDTEGEVGWGRGGVRRRRRRGRRNRIGGMETVFC